MGVLTLVTKDAAKGGMVVTLENIIGVERRRRSTFSMAKRAQNWRPSRFLPWRAMTPSTGSDPGTALTDALVANRNDYVVIKSFQAAAEILR